MKRLYIATEGCGQITSNDTYFSGIWFSSAKTSDEEMAVGVNYFGTEKMSHKVFFLARLEILMKYCPGGSYLVMKSTPRFTGERLILAIRYK